MNLCLKVGELAHALVQQWKRLLMAYSPPREEQEGGFLDDLSFSEEEEEEMGEVVAVPPGGWDSPTDSSDEFGFTLFHHHIHCTWRNVCTG